MAAWSRNCMNPYLVWKKPPTAYPAVSSTVQHTGREGNTRLRNQEAVTQMQATSASITQTMSFNRKESPIATAIQVEGISS